MKVKMPRKAIAGRMIGTHTCRYCRKNPQPSRVAASMSSRGMALLEYCRSQNTPNELASEGTMTALRSPTHPILLMRTNCGIVASWVGSRNVVRTMPNNTFLPGNSNLANAKAANEAMNSTSTDTVMATTAVLAIAAQMLIFSVMVWTFSPNRLPGVSTGGYR